MVTPYPTIPLPRYPHASAPDVEEFQRVPEPIEATALERVAETLLHSLDCFPVVPLHDTLGDHHLYGHVQQPLHPALHLRRHKLMHHLSGAVYHEAVLEGVIALLGNRPLPNQVQFNLDACDVLTNSANTSFRPSSYSFFSISSRMTAGSGGASLTSKAPNRNRSYNVRFSGSPITS